MTTPQSCQPFMRPNFNLYHSNAKGTGCAIKMTLHPAHDNTDGSIWLTLANQTTVGDRKGPNPVYPRYDWENSLCTKLGFSDLCQILQVFRGETESIADGKGLYHSSPIGTTRILFRHMLSPVTGYLLEVFRSPRNGGEDMGAHFLFTNAEAIGLCQAITGVIGVIVFGIPTIQSHDASAYEAKVKEMRHAPAAKE